MSFIYGLLLGIGKVFLNLPSQNSSDIYSIYEHEVSGSIPVRVDIIPTDTPYENAVSKIRLQITFRSRKIIVLNLNL